MVDVVEGGYLLAARGASQVLQMSFAQYASRLGIETVVRVGARRRERGDACTSRYTEVSGVSQTGSKEGNRRMGPRGDANLRLGLHVRACECWACARYVYVRNDKRVCAQVSTKEEVWVPRGVVGW